MSVPAKPWEVDAQERPSAISSSRPSRSFPTGLLTQTAWQHPGASARRTRRAVHQLSLRASTTSFQSFQRALCCSKTMATCSDSGPGRARGVLVGLATSTTTTAATHRLAPEALQQWRELQRLQRRIQRTLDQMRDPSRQLPARTPTAILEQLRDRIKAIALDESNTSRAPPSFSHVGTANADEALGAEATTQATETKEEI